MAQPEHLTFDIQAPFLAGSQPLLHGQVGVRSLFIDSIENSRSHSLDCERTRRIQGLLSAARRGARNAAHCVIVRSEEHTSELQSLMRISYAVFCLKKKNTNILRRLDTDKKTHIRNRRR